MRYAYDIHYMPQLEASHWLCHAVSWFAGRKVRVGSLNKQIANGGRRSLDRTLSRSWLAKYLQLQAKAWAKKRIFQDLFRTGESLTAVDTLAFTCCNSATNLLSMQYFTSYARLPEVDVPTHSSKL